MANNEKIPTFSENILKNEFQFEIENNSINKIGKRHKFLITSILFFCSMAYGMTSYIIGPALKDMKVRLNTTLDNITIVFGCVLVGYTLGAIINGIIFNYINRQVVLICLLFMMSCTITLAPLCKSLGLLFGDATITGFGAGGFDTAQVVWIIELWAEKAGSYLQGIQFFFALGTFLSPLITRPFLAKYNSTEATNKTFMKNGTNEELLVESRIEIPFGIVGSFLVISSILLLLLHFYKRYDPPNDQNQECVCKCPSSLKLIYIILGFFTLTPYVGLEIMNFQLMPTFALYSHLKLSESESAVVLSCLAGAFTIGRGICFFISMKYSLENFIFVNYFIIIIANIILLLFELNHNSLIMLWIGQVILGLGLSSVFPAVYAFLDRHITIDNSMGAFYVCTSGLMAALLPTLCGQFIENEPLALIYINFICISIVSLAFLGFNILVYIRRNSSSGPTHTHSQ